MSRTDIDGGPTELEQKTMSKVLWRLMPFLMICYCINFLDRGNVAFAALGMIKALHLTQAEFGFGAGLFFIAYAAFEIPSNLVLYKVGARRWIARIMFTWGLAAGAMALAVGPYSYYFIRMLLGVAEAGFQPGVLFLVTLWFPEAYRGRVFGLFFAAIPISQMISGPASGFLLGMDGLFGFEGWQWLFLIEALPALIMAPVVLFYLQDDPKHATWLPDDGRNWLATRLASEKKRVETKKVYSIFQSLYNPTVLFLAAVYFTNVLLNNAVPVFLPQIVKGFGLTNIQTGFVASIPSVVALFTVILYGRHADKMRSRFGHAAFANGLAGLSLVAVSVLGTSIPYANYIELALLSVTVSMTLSFAGVFWAIPGMFLSGGSAAGGLAAISAMGVVAGFVAPWFTGFIKDQTGSFSWAFGTVGVLAIVSALALVDFGRRTKAEQLASLAAGSSSKAAE
jgi:MFS family permease